MKQGKSKDCPVMRNHQVGQASTDVGLRGGTSVHWFSDALPNVQNAISAGRKEHKWPHRSSLQRKKSKLQVNGVSTWFFSMKTDAYTGRFVSPAGQSSMSFASLQTPWERCGGHTPSMPTTEFLMNLKDTSAQPWCLDKKVLFLLFQYFDICCICWLVFDTHVRC